MQQVLSTIDQVVTETVNEIRKYRKELEDVICSGNTPGDDYFKTTGQLNGLKQAEAILVEMGRKFYDMNIREEM